MTVLQRTDLTTSQKIQCAAAAVAGQHAHGSKTALRSRIEIKFPTSPRVQLIVPVAVEFVAM